MVCGHWFRKGSIVFNITIFVIIVNVFVLGYSLSAREKNEDTGAISITVQRAEFGNWIPRDQSKGNPGVFKVTH